MPTENWRRNSSKTPAVGAAAHLRRISAVRRKSRNPEFSLAPALPNQNSDIGAISDVENP